MAAIRIFQKRKLLQKLQKISLKFSKENNMEVESTVGKKRYFKRGVLLCKGRRFGKVTVEATITQPSSPPW